MTSILKFRFRKQETIVWADQLVSCDKYVWIRKETDLEFY